MTMKTKSQISMALVSGPSADIISLDDAKAHLRVTDDADDDYIAALISSVTQFLDGWSGILGRALITQTWDVRMDSFVTDDDDIVYLPLSPLQSIESITYVDDAGTTQEMPSSQYDVDIDATPARLKPAYGYCWPVPRWQMNAVTIRMTVGYGDAAANIPQPIIHAAKLLIGHMYENRESTTPATLSELPQGVKYLLAPFRGYRL